MRVNNRILARMGVLALALGLTALPCRVPADSLSLDDGKTITGQITYEDDQKVEIQTQDYGPLTFKKYRVKSIQRQLGGASAPAAQPAAPAAPAVNPFAAGAAPGAGAALGASAPAAGNPFASAAAPGAGTVPGAAAPLPGNPFGPTTAAAAASTPPAGQPANPFAPGAAVAAPGAQPSNPFGATAPAAAAPGVAAPPGGNPFAPGAATGAPAVQPSNPFGAGAPTSPDAGMAGAATSNPFGAGAGAPATQPGTGFPPAGSSGPSEAVAASTQPAAIPALDQAASLPEGSIPTLPSALDTDVAPDIPAGYDGVLYGIATGDAVEVKRPEQEEWGTAENNTPLQIHSAVRTGEGKAKIRLRGRDTLRLPPRTHIVLVELSVDASKVTIEVKTGSLWTEVAPRARASDFRVVTPDLTAGVRGTLFKTMVQPGTGSRVAVLQSAVDVTSNKTGESTLVPANKAVVVNTDGQIEPLVPVWPAEYDEWAAWDEWRLDAYKNVAAFSSVGAPIIQGLIDQTAQDNARYEATVNDTNRTIQINKYEDALKIYANAFRKFAEDTGYVPDPETDGWQVLRENKGNWPGWSGPYLTVAQMPPVDMWHRPVHYMVRYNRSGANIHGLVYSEGPDRRDDKGRPGGDDIVAYAMYYQIPSIANNPKYQSAPTTNP